MIALLPGASVVDDVCRPMSCSRMAKTCSVSEFSSGSNDTAYFTEESVEMLV